MNSNLRYLWEKLRTSYWFVPAILAVGAMMLSAITVEIDRGLSEHETWTVSWTYTGGPEGARAVLATVAGSMITVAAFCSKSKLIFDALHGSERSRGLKRKIVIPRSGTTTLAFRREWGQREAMSREKRINGTGTDDGASPIYSEARCSR